MSAGEVPASATALAREELEAALWRAGCTVADVDAALALADAYAAASVSQAQETAARRSELSHAVQPANLMPCGTRAAAVRHRRHGEPLDEACRRAENEESLRRWHQAAANGRAARPADAAGTGRAAA